MKIKSKMIRTLALTICLFFTVFSFAQEQVILDGNMTTTTITFPNGIMPGFDDTVDYLEEVFFRSLQAIFGPVTAYGMIFGNDEDEAGNAIDQFFDGNSEPIITAQDFTITYTQEMMHMVARNDEGTVMMMLRFGPEGNNLHMTMKVNDQNPMSIRVPKGNTISATTENQLQPAPIENAEIIGYTADKYTFLNRSTIDLGNKVKVDYQNLKRSDSGEVWLAPDAPGIGLMRGFYLNLTLGGYDLGGAENGGMMAIIGRLLDRGIPLKTKEETIVNSNGYRNDVIYRSTTLTNITSIVLEPLDEDLPFTLAGQPNTGSSDNTASPATAMDAQGGSQPASNTQSGSDAASGPQNGSAGTSTNNRDAEGGCDCSCEKYAEYMKMSKMSKKEKKNIDMGNFQMMDMNCIKECITFWAKCVSVKQ